MIHKNEFNSRWLGYDVGFVTDLNFFYLPTKDRQDFLSNFQWVELRFADVPVNLLNQIHSSGFYYIDSQVKFELSLNKVLEDETTVGLQCIPANIQPFSINLNEIYSFANERFLAISGITQKMVDIRYLEIANQLINQHPEFCLRITDGYQTQGWYFGKPSDEGFELSLAMLHKNTSIRGKQLYRKAIVNYAHSFRNGAARFSINNLPVHNILANFGARFFAPETVWVWVKS